MSSDNYYTTRQEDGKWYLFHGFMSNLEDGFYATGRDSPAFDTETEVLAFYWEKNDGSFMGPYYSEYGLINEGDPVYLSHLREAYFEKWPEDRNEEWTKEYR